ncbi:uncharacterized protein LOC119282158 [Triticum dicoccoides]|uniref:Uncharacterized protein n=1 Tax=Triticum turgidum subsp. durum TaxID=4567 RepID=A0A9R1S9D0_TRITD|nr:uncharacterized protein LOC119282158 [Triticum dicoccoides]VAH84524.1 unnamed protein product [Triticum turgidum subsp. durum]
MSATSELSIRNDGHLIDIAPSPTTGINQSGRGGEIHTEWLRELTSASRSAAVLNDLVGRTPMLWYLGERAATILRPRSRRADLKALHAVRAVAIGPYHRGDRGLAFDDEAKLPFLRYLQDQCGLDVEQYVAALGAARGCFRDEFADDADAVAADWLRDEEKFVKMLLLDSSFLLVFSLMFGKAGGWGERAAALVVTRERFVLYTAVAQYADEIKLDLLVLENQIPFAVVKLLAASCRGLKLRSVEELMLGCFDCICPTRARGKVDLLLRETTDAKFYHILHLFHWSRVPENKYGVLSVPLKLLEAKEESDQSGWIMPCARELHRAAVWFRKPSLDGAERHGGDLNMEFRSAAASPMAVMTIPSFHILAYTAALLHSMLAFEKHFHWAHGACVTVHVKRMEGLIRCPQDAALLRRRWILGSVKCTDEEVVDFFRDMVLEAAGVPMPEEYGEMIRAVARHRRRRARRWCGDLILHFLPSPWVSVSLAAVVALIIVPAMLQTIYTILGYQK